jgi:hypothetical protein
MWILFLDDDSMQGKLYYPRFGDHDCVYFQGEVSTRSTSLLMTAPVVAHDHTLVILTTVTIFPLGPSVSMCQLFRTLTHSEHKWSSIASYGWWAEIAQWYSTGLWTGWAGIRVATGTGNLSPHPRVQTGSGTHPASYSMGTSGSFPGGKAAGAYSWPLTSIQCRGQECVELYCHSPNTPSWRGAHWLLVDRLQENLDSDDFEWGV